MNKFELLQFANDIELADAAAREWLRELEAANRGARQRHVALSGGRIARRFFSAVTEQAISSRVSLNTVHFFWADERCVPPENPESNSRVAKELMFTPLQIPEVQVHRIRGEKRPDLAAAEAEAEICRIAPLNPEGQPALDLILLGMGEDGHVASLFPGEPESVRANPAVYRAVTASKPPPQRITMGCLAIAAARHVWVLASGSGKEAALRESLSPTGLTPLAGVIRSRAMTRIFTDIQTG